MALNYTEISKKLVELLGGTSNIISVTHCMTRLRIVLKDEEKADDVSIEKLKGIKGVMRQGGQYQIIVGNEVSNLYKEFIKLGDFSADSAPKKEEGNIVQRLFGFVAGCMTPLLPAMLGTGMVKVILTLLTTFAGVSTDTSTYVILNTMGDCFLLFFPVFLAYTAAKKINGSPVLFMIVGAALVYPDLLTLLAGNSLELGKFMGMNCTYFFGIPVICATYTSSVLPILLMTPIMKWVEDFADRISPNILKSFLKPFLFTVICVPIALIIVGPLGNVAGNGLSFVLEALYNTCGWLAIGIMAALMPFIVMTGMHYALIPLMMNALTTSGCDPFVLISMFASNLAQGGAAIGVAAKSKNTEIKSEGVASGISAILAGVTEPALYGTNLRFRTPMIGACIGAAVSGIICGITKVVAYVYGGSPSILSLITFIGGNKPMQGVIFGAIAGGITLVLSFGITYVIYKDEITDTKEDSTAKEIVKTEEKSEEIQEKPSLIKKITLLSPMTGKLVSLSEVPDQVFSAGILGEGAAIIPTEGKVIAPCDCEVTMTMDSGHAIGLKTADGMELLIHVGLNTVELNGKYFEYKVEKGDKVKQGDVLITFDREAIQNEGYKLHTPVIIANPDDYVSIRVVEKTEIQIGDELMKIV